MRFGEFDYSVDELMCALGTIPKDAHLRAALEHIEWLEAEIERLKNREHHHVEESSGQCLADR